MVATVTACYRRAWTQLQRTWLALLLVTLGSGVLAEVPDVVARAVQRHQHPATDATVTLLSVVLLTIPLSYGCMYALLRAARGERGVAAALLTPFRDVYAASILSWLLYGVAVLVGLLLFVLPGIYVGARLAFVPFLVVDEHLGAFAALEESWRRSRGHAGAVIAVLAFGLVTMTLPATPLLVLIVQHSTNLPLYGAAVVVLVAGVVFACMLNWLAYAALFATISPLRSATAAVDTAAAAS